MVSFDSFSKKTLFLSGRFNSAAFDNIWTLFLHSFVSPKNIEAPAVFFSDI